MSKEIKVAKLPVRWDFRNSWCKRYWHIPSDDSVKEDIKVNHIDYYREDFNDPEDDYWCGDVITSKMKMLTYVKDFFTREGIPFDELNGKLPTRFNKYSAYEYSTLALWSMLISIIDDPEFIKLNKTFYTKYGKVISTVFRKYPKLTGDILTLVDLKVPGNELLDIAMSEEVDFDADHTDEAVVVDAKADEFKQWILRWCNSAEPKDKMRVRNWFETKKSHKQIFSEINRVVGNQHKFNTRLALFVERLFNKEGLDYFFDKTGYDSKEALLLAYFDKLTMFDDETKKSFVKKYLV